MTTDQMKRYLPNIIALVIWMIASVLFFKYLPNDMAVMAAVFAFGGFIMWTARGKDYE